MPLPLSEHVANTQRAYNNLVEHLVSTSAELNDWLPILRDVAPAHLEELRELGPRANWSGEHAGQFRHYGGRTIVGTENNAKPIWAPKTSCFVSLSQLTDLELIVDRVLLNK